MQLKPLPEQAPVHPANCEPVAGLAVSVMDVLAGKVALQVLPQLMPLGVLVTDPVPVPSLVTVRVLLTTTASNCALTLRAWSMLTVQLPDPRQAPDHPTNCEPIAALAVSVTEVPCAKDCVADGQLASQLRPAGELLTVPWPVPDLDSVSNLCVMLKVATTVRSDCMSKVQLAVPVQAPDQPMNVEPVAGLAVSVTVVLAGKVAVQVLPQLMPLGVLVTEPVPEPSLVTVMVLLTALASNCALTLRAWSMLTVQLAVPLHAPVQPAKTDPAVAVAVKVTLELAPNLAEQLLPQEIKGWSKLMPV